MYLLPSYEWLHMKLSVVQNYASVFCYNKKSILKMKFNKSQNVSLIKLKLYCRLLQTQSIQLEVIYALFIALKT